MKMTDLPALLCREQAGQNAKCSTMTDRLRIDGRADKKSLDFHMQFCSLIFDL
jgi:hypothetical protein